MAFWSWSRTAATNSSADSSINWAEGQAPSSVNDSARAMMARTAEYRDDVAGAITTGGTATAYTLTSFQVFDTLAHMSGQMVAFTPHATNINAVGVDITLSVDGLAAKSIRAQPSVALPNGSLILGTPYVALYNNVDGVFYLQGQTNPYSIPLAGGLDFWGTTTPNSSFAFPAGQAISRTTYATLFTLLSTTYGVGDGSTTFNLPDKTGRVSAMKEASASRLTSTYFGALSGQGGGTLGAVGGGESHTLSIGEMPSHNHGGATGTPTISLGTFLGGTAAPAGSNTRICLTGAGGDQTVAFSSYQIGAPAVGTSSISAQGSGTAHAIVPPTIVCNYILRII